MGCDIHFYVEVRKDGQWVSADKWTKNEYHDPSDPDSDPRPMTIEYDDRFYRGRNYDLFGILANVRNGRGFAGVKTGEGFTPIAMPKGLPADVSPEVAAESEFWGPDGHSHSWHTLADLLAYDWNQTTAHQGVVDALNYYIWKTEGKPRAWAGDVGGGSVEKVTLDEMEQAVVGGGWTRDLYTTVSWKEPYHVSAHHFYTKTLPELQALGSPDDVRIVFWFDN